MQSFIQQFCTLCVTPPQLHELLPKDQTAYLPAQQLLHESKYDPSPEGQFLKHKADKLLSLLKNSSNSIPKSPIRSKSHHECKQRKIDIQHNENLNHTNKQIQKQQTISELSKVQYRISTQRIRTPQQRAKQQSSYEEYRARRVSPKVQRTRKNHLQEELSDSKALFEKEKQIYTQLLELQHQLQALHTPRPSSSPNNFQSIPLECRTKTVRLDLTPSKKVHKNPQTKDISEKKPQEKEGTKTRLLTDRIEKAIRS